MTRRPPARQEPIETHCCCFGYHGFGSGWYMGEREKVGLMPKHNDQTYCSGRCPRKQECWDRHRERVRSIVPDLCDELDRALDLALDAGDPGSEIVQDFIARHGSEPYLAVMLGNIADGHRCARGLKPEDRAEGSITWPLVALG